MMKKVSLKGVMISSYVPAQELKIYKQVDSKYEKQVANDTLKNTNLNRYMLKQRQTNTNKIINSSIKRNTTGLWMAFIITIVTMIITAILVTNGHYVYGIFSGGAFIACLTRFTPVKHDTSNKTK